ncbi:MAG: hypothetical protein HYV09_29065 [Deltaproteobacteria bacterium]|nr:hypothetical protein [Deltaproteobacteria bacterium]
MSHRVLGVLVVLFATIACSTGGSEPVPPLEGETSVAGDAADDAAPDANETDDSALPTDTGADAPEAPPETGPKSCEPNPCSSPSRMRCVVTDAGVECLCNAGTHDESGVCVPDVTCTAGTCNGHGACSDAGGTIGCTCDAGYSGARCEKCDESKGYHADGAGGCTTDVCKPDPCSSKPNTRCVAGSSGASCVCATGYHDDGTGACVIDEACGPSTCSGHGTCSVVSGKTTCACEAGWAGLSCATCASTHHPDGAGGCTTDPCKPNLCTAANKTACAADPSKTAGYRCDCDAGFHDDGTGACTNDPCKPDPCVAANQACENKGDGTYRCYTPPCADDNPCTVDVVEGGVCKHKVVGDGTACSTTLCKTGSTCVAGVCQGGAPIACNDDNPCTRDSCDPTKGCQYVNDDTLVPADAWDCTVDSCAGGLAQHVPSDARCDDGKWCTGVESCKPADPGAKSTGCVVSGVPAPPAAPSPCRSYGACDEASKSFPLVTRPTGDPCDDGLACTTTDKCAYDGACRGTVTTSCTAATSCTSTTALSSVIDFRMAKLSGRFTQGGGAIPSSSKGGDVDVYLVNKITGSRQRIGGPRYSYSGSGYVLVSGTDTYSTLVMPGVFDVLFRRGWNYADSGNWVYTTTAGDTLPDGDQILQRDFVVGPGDNVLDVDWGVSSLSGTITFKGGPIPSTGKGGDVDIYLVNKVTGSRQRIGGPRYSYSGSGYVLVSGTNAYSTLVMPGTYDVVYRRGWNAAAGGNWVYTTTSGDTLPDGDQILQRDVVIAPGSKTLDVDFGATTLSGSFTLATGAIPATSKGGDVDVFLVNKATGSRQRIGGPKYSYSGSGYVLVSGTNAYSTLVMPGTYDVLYRRGWNYAASGNWVYTTTAGDTLADGDRILQRDVVVSGASQTLDVDFGLSTITGNFTLSGGAIPTTSKGGDVDIYLVNKDTRSRQRIGGPRYSYSGSGYVLVSGSASCATLVMPGTYDVLYRRGWNGADGGNWVYTTTAGDTLADGDRILQRDVVVPPGASTLSVDFGIATVSGTFTLSGGAVPAASKGGDVDVYFVNKDTGSRQRVGGPRYSYSGSGYVLVSGTNAYSTLVMPGTYDVLYRRGWNYSAGDTWVYTTTAGDSLADGDVILLTDVVVPSTGKTLDIDFGKAAIAGSFTFAGGAIPASSKGGDVDIYLVNRVTGSRQRIGGPRYSYSSPGYVLVSGSDAFATLVMPGVYDVLYRRGWNYAAGGSWVYTTTAGDTLPDADERLRACVMVP